MAGRKSEFKYDIIEEYGVIEESPTSDMSIEVNKISWNDNPPKIDIRRINRNTKDGNIAFSKGISLSDEACVELCRILKELGYDEEVEEEKPKKKKKKKKIEIDEDRDD